SYSSKPAPCAFLILLRSLRSTPFPLTPFAIAAADGGLRGNLLGKKTVRRRRRNPPRRSVRLVQEAAIFEIRHDVANGSGAQGFLEALGNCARRYRFARLNVRANDVGENLAVPPFL